MEVKAVWLGHKCESQGFTSLRSKIVDSVTDFVEIMPVVVFYAGMEKRVTILHYEFILVDMGTVD